VKILTLEVEGFRGIRHAKLDFDGRNAVIWGPNGSGKSAVVDAVDFLLTGQIARLGGEGTAGITLAKHGPHIDFAAKPDNVIVRATASIPGVQDTVTLTRRMDAPQSLAVDGARQEQLADVLDVASRRQHSLTRREILRYVASQPAKRSEEVQSLLKLGQLESIRKSLTRVRNQARKTESTAVTNTAAAESRVVSVLGIDQFSSQAVLDQVNALRKALEGAPISELKPSGLKSGVTHPSGVSKAKVPAVSSVDRAASSLETACEDLEGTRAQLETELRASIAKIRRNEASKQDLQRLQLLKLGVSMLDDTGRCPLCGSQWKPEELAQHLEQCMERAVSIESMQSRVQEIVSSIRRDIAGATTSVEVLEQAGDALKLSSASSILRSWIEDLTSLDTHASTILDTCAESKWTVEQTAGLLRDESRHTAVQKVLSEIKAAAGGPTPEEAAWDALTKTELHLEALEECRSAEAGAKLYHARAAQLLRAFEDVRDEELDALYGAIETRFAELYRCLHGDDEGAFDADLKPDGSFEVDFYGRGKHPPGALHSEGHQDSMGVCLYLALVEHLTGDRFLLTLLDDVVMSVDAGHRNRLCAMLKQQFPNRQFLITTHDKTWASQLRAEGVINRAGYIEFTRWSLEDGPCIELEGELWSVIGKHLDSDDVPGAAFRLRNGAERHFEAACDDLGAHIRYHADGRWVLGEFMNSAVGRLRDWLKLAKKAANSWGQSELVETLGEYETVLRQVVERTYCEQWAVNAAVHYNTWHDLSKEDFLPVAEAFQDCFALFSCQSCKGPLRLVESGLTPEAVKCSCGDVHWNLAVKP